MPPPPPPPVAWTVDNALAPAALLPELRDDEPAQALLDAIDLSLGKFTALAADGVLRFGAEAVPVSRVIASLGEFRSKLAELGLSEAFFRYVRENFIFYSSAAPQVIFTGYYEPLLRGSRSESPHYPYPLYGRPGDLVTVDQKQFYFYKDQPNLPQIKGRVEGNRLDPLLHPRRDRFPEQAGRPRPGDRLDRQPGRHFFPAYPGLGHRPVRGRQPHVRGLCRPERPPLPLHRQVPARQRSSSTAASSPCRG